LSARAVPGSTQPARNRTHRHETTAEARTDNIWWQAWTQEDLATVLERAGRTDKAREALERSLAIWQRKGCLPCAARVREQIAALERANV
jgi:hypothetical protein